MSTNPEDPVGDDQQEEQAQTAAQDQADNQQPTTTSRGRQVAEGVIGNILHQGENDPQERSLIAQYGLNAQQARQILQRARDTLEQNAPQQINLAAASKMSPSWTPGGTYTGAMSAASEKQQEILDQLQKYDLGMNQAGLNSLNAQLGLLKQKYSDVAKMGPAAMRVEGLPDAQKGPAAQAEQFAQMLGYQRGSPEYKAFVEKAADAAVQGKLPPLKLMDDGSGHPVYGYEERDASGSPTLHSIGVKGFNATIAGANAMSPGALDMAYQDALINGIPHALSMIGARNIQARMHALDYISSQAKLNGNSALSFTVDQELTKGANATFEDFTNPKGTAAKQLNAINTSVMHAKVADELIGKMGNGPFKMTNDLKNWWMNQTGESSAPNDYNEVIDFLGGEIQKAAVAAGTGGQEERKDFKKSYSSGLDPTILHSAIAKARQIIAGKTASYRLQWDNGTMGRYGEFEKHLLSETKEALGINAGAAPAAGAGDMVRVVNPKGVTGNIPRAKLEAAKAAGYKEAP